MQSRIINNKVAILIISLILSFQSEAQIPCQSPPVQPRIGQTPEDICCSEASRLTNCLASCNQALIICHQDEQEKDDELERLRRDLRQCKNENSALRRYNNQLRIDSTKLAETVVRQRDSILNLNKKIKELESELKHYKGIVACIEEFEQEKQRIRDSARFQLDVAKMEFGRYSRAKGKQQDSLRLRIWDIYSKFTTVPVYKSCGPFKLNETLNLKNGEDHYFMAKLLIDDNGTIYNKLGDDFCDKIRNMNAGMLAELGMALASTETYNGKAEIYNEVEKLISVIVAERKCWKNQHQAEESSSPDGAPALDTMGFGGTKTSYSLEHIYDLYKKGDYASAIGVYNRLYRLLELDEVKKNKELVSKVKFSIGTILLWNLGDVESYHGLVVQGSWFDENHKRSKEIGRDLLFEAAKISNKYPEIREKAFIVMRKKH